MGPGLGATDDEAVDADGGLELRSRFTGDLVRVAGRAEEPLEDLPVDEGTRSIFNRNEKPIMHSFMKLIYGCRHLFKNSFFENILRLNMPYFKMFQIYKYIKKGTTIHRLS